MPAAAFGSDLFSYLPFLSFEYSAKPVSLIRKIWMNSIKVDHSEVKVIRMILDSQI